MDDETKIYLNETEIVSNHGEMKNKQQMKLVNVTMMRAQKTQLMQLTD